MSRNPLSATPLVFLIIYFPAIFPSSPLGRTRDVGGLSIVSWRAFHVLSDARRVLVSLPLALSFFLSDTFSKGTLFIVPGDALHYALTCLIMHSFMQPLPYVNALYD